MSYAIFQKLTVNLKETVRDDLNRSIITRIWKKEEEEKEIPGFHPPAPRPLSVCICSIGYAFKKSPTFH